MPSACLLLLPLFRTGLIHPSTAPPPAPSVMQVPAACQRPHHPPAHVCTERACTPVPMQLSKQQQVPHAFATKYDSLVFHLRKKKNSTRHTQTFLHPPSRPGGHISQPREAGKSNPAVQQVASALARDFPGHRTRPQLWHLSRGRWACERAAEAES